MEDSISLSILRQTPLTTEIATKEWTSKNFAVLSSVTKLSSEIINGLSDIVNPKLSTIADNVEEEVEKIDEISAKFEVVNDKLTGYVEKEDFKELSNDFYTVVSAAPEAFDTLKEIADWIGDDQSGASAVIAQISGIKDDLGNKISAITINGEDKTPTNGKVDLGKFMPLSGRSITTESGVKFVVSAIDDTQYPTDNFIGIGVEESTLTFGNPRAPDGGQKTLTPYLNLSGSSDIHAETPYILFRDGTKLWTTVHTHDISSITNLSSVLSNINDGILTFYKNGVTVASFSANQSNNTSVDISVPDVSLQGNSLTVDGNSINIPNVSVNGNSLTVDGNSISVPTYTSQLINDSGFLTSMQAIPALSVKYFNSALDGSDVSAALDQLFKESLWIDTDKNLMLDESPVSSLNINNNAVVTENLLSDYVTLNTNQEISGIKYFLKQIEAPSYVAVDDTGTFNGTTFIYPGSIFIEENDNASIISANDVSGLIFNSVGIETNGFFLLPKTADQSVQTIATEKYVDNRCSILPISSVDSNSIELGTTKTVYRVTDANNTGTFPTLVAPTDITQTGDYYFTFEIEWTTAASLASYGSQYDWINYPEMQNDGTQHTYYIAGRWDSGGSGASAFTLNCWRTKKLTA